MKIIIKKYLLLICLFLALPLHAEDSSNLYAMIDSKLIAPSLQEQAIVLGEERATVCAYCHGPDGNSTRDYIPNLADQNPKYLLRQFEMFATGQRPNKIMSELAKNLSNEDRINISLFFSSKKAKPAPALPPEVTASASKLFQSHCSTCHGNNGHGKEVLPRIASQPAEYIKRTLSNYRSNPDFRPNSPMQAIVTSLNTSDDEILASYIASME